MLVAYRVLVLNRWSSENEPAPWTTSARDKIAMSKGNSYPWSVQKKPFAKFTKNIAASTFTVSANALMRVNKPSARKIGEKNSVRIASMVKIGKIPIDDSKKLMVPEKPEPPNHPRSFCAPCGNMTRASDQRTTGIIALGFVRNRDDIGVSHHCLLAWSIYQNDSGRP